MAAIPVNTYIHVCTHAFTCMHSTLKLVHHIACICNYTCTPACACTHTHTHTRHMHPQKVTHTNVHTHTHARTHTRTHARTHACTHTQQDSERNRQADTSIKPHYPNMIHTLIVTQIDITSSSCPVTIARLRKRLNGKATVKTISLTPVS